MTSNRLGPDRLAVRLSQCHLCPHPGCRVFFPGALDMGKHSRCDLHGIMAQFDSNNNIEYRRTM
jgi:hypothetical protein